MSSWGCPHEVDGVCQRVRGALCDPGMLGRVVQGKVETLGEPRGARRPVLTDELSHAGFEKDPPGSLTERNRPVGGRALARSGPVVYEGTFRRRGPG